MVLSDKDIRRYLGGVPSFSSYEDAVRTIKLTPFDETQVQPASIDLKLAGEFRRYASPTEGILNYLSDPNNSLFSAPQIEDFTVDLNDKKMASTELVCEDKYELKPDEFILGSTNEFVEIPDNLCARVEGKSSLGRLGLLIHATAGYIDPGFKGKITLEIKNLNNRPIILRAGKPVCQLSFTELSSPAQHPYGHERLNSKYQGQNEVTGSHYQG